MKPLESKTPEELAQSLIDSTEVLEFVPRKLLIESIGAELASQFLPELPDHVSVNKDKLLMVLQLSNPELFTQND